MNIIKFRGKRKDNGEWVYGYYIKNSEGRGFIVHSIYIDLIDNPSTAKPGITCFEVVPETVGQCTGLKDKNDKEIYEGDICKVPEKQYEWFKKGKTFEVEWDKGMTGFNPFRNHSYLENHCEVIGNIHENKELKE